MIQIALFNPKKASPKHLENEIIQL